MSPQRKRPIDLGVIAEVVRASDYLIKSAQRPQQNKIFGRKVMDKLNPIQMRKPSPLSSTRIVGLATSQQRRPSIQNPYENHKKPKNQKRKTPTKQKTKKTKNQKTTGKTTKTTTKTTIQTTTKTTTKTTIQTTTKTTIGKRTYPPKTSAQKIAVILENTLKYVLIKCKFWGKNKSLYRGYQGNITHFY